MGAESSTNNQQQMEREESEREDYYLDEPAHLEVIDDLYRNHFHNNEMFDDSSSE